MTIRFLSLAAFLSIVPGLALAQSSLDRSFEATAQIAVNDLAELETTEVGLGGRLGFRAGSLFTFEGELNFYPSDVPEAIQVTSSRLEGLFGVKVGPRFDRWSIFGKFRPGFVQFAEAPAPFPCIAIYPPPLSCVLGAGGNVFALDLGGGVELYPSERSLIRVDASDRMLHYPGPAIRQGREVVLEDGFWAHGLRLAIGAGFRF
jgi:hypothetical protein